MKTDIAAEYMLYDVADALFMEIHDMGDRFRGFDTRKVRIGPWSIDANISLVSDVVEMNVCSFFVKVMGNLWLYLVKDIHCEGLKAYVLDGGVLKLHVKNIATYGGVSVADTLKKLEKGLITQYGFNEQLRRWEECYEPTSHLDDSGKAGSATKALPSPKTL